MTEIRIGFVDNGLGTGGVFNFTGSTAGWTNELYLAKNAWGIGHEQFLLKATRVGDGAVSVTGLTPGPYTAMVASKNGSTIVYSFPTLFRVQTTQLPLAERCAQVLKDHVLSLNIPGVPTDPTVHVLAKVGEKFEVIVRGKQERQAVYYLWAPSTSSVADNSMNRVKIPIVVSWVMQQEVSQSIVASKTNILRFREILENSMAVIDAVEIPEVDQITYLPGAVIDPSQWIEGSDATTTTINFWAEVYQGVQ